VWRSGLLEALWSQDRKSLGLSELGSVTFESAAYVARYIMKKQSNWAVGRNVDGVYESVDLEGVVTTRNAEYCTMSRRPGIGKPWLDKYMCEVFPADSVVVRGKLQRPPKYYKGMLELASPLDHEFVAEQRRRMRDLEDNTPARLLVREEVAIAALAQKGRDL
jgi:hypothetical protein